MSFAILWLTTSLATASYLDNFLGNTTILPADELRAAWVVRHALNSQEDIDRAVDFAVNARFHLLFVQVRGRGDAYYASTLEPLARTLQQPIDEFDPLAYFLQRAHAEGISVHVWVNAFYVWSDHATAPPRDHIVRKHPEWLMSDRSGARMDDHTVREWQGRGLEGYYVSPGHPEVRQHMIAVVRDIVTRYAVDGIHLDYIRYPNGDFDYGARERTEFMLRYGVDPLAKWEHNPDLPLLGERGVQLVDSLRTDWRVAQVDSVVRGIRNAIGDTPLSAAVFPEYIGARLDKGQDWLGWIQRGDVDFVVPMAYSYEPAELRQQVEKITRMIGSTNFLVGLPVYDGKSQYLGYSVSLLRRDGVLGYSLFSYNALEEEQYSLQFLERVFLSQQPPSPE